MRFLMPEYDRAASRHPSFSFLRVQQQQCRFRRLRKRPSEYAVMQKFHLYGSMTPLEYPIDMLGTSTTVTLSSVAPPPTGIYEMSSSIVTPPTFEPILNVPALTVFLFIMTVFLALQWRIRAIDDAANQRNLALQKLRQSKALELSDPTISNNDSNQVQVALQEYRRAYDRMEELRTVLPGIRIVSPPSSNISRQTQEEHEIAAQQFLGIFPLKDDDNVNKMGNENILPVPSGARINEEQLSKNPSSLMSTMTVRNIILVLVATTQIVLFLFLIGTDPMKPSSLMNTRDAYVTIQDDTSSSNSE